MAGNIGYKRKLFSDKTNIPLGSSVSYNLIDEFGNYSMVVVCIHCAQYGGIFVVPIWGQFSSYTPFVAVPTEYFTLTNSAGVITITPTQMGLNPAIVAYRLC